MLLDGDHTEGKHC